MLHSSVSLWNVSGKKQDGEDTAVSSDLVKAEVHKSRYVCVAVGLLLIVAIQSNIHLFKRWQIINKLSESSALQYMW